MYQWQFRIPKLGNKQENLRMIHSEKMEGWARDSHPCGTNELFPAAEPGKTSPAVLFSPHPNPCFHTLSRVKDWAFVTDALLWNNRDHWLASFPVHVSPTPYRVWNLGGPFAKTLPTLTSMDSGRQLQLGITRGWGVRGIGCYAEWALVFWG